MRVGKVESEKILGKVREERQITKRITQKQLKFFGYIVREDGFEKLAPEWKIDNARYRGRQRKYLSDCPPDLFTLSGKKFTGPLNLQPT